MTDDPPRPNGSATGPAHDGARAGSRGPGSSRVGRDQVVADLDAELRTARRELGERLDALAAEFEATRATTASTTGLVAETLPRLDGLFGEVAELRGRIDQLAALVPKDPETPPVCWPALDVDEATAAWHALAGWVADVLGPWYQLTRGQLPDCWALHRPAVLELSWLHTCWTDAYLPHARPASAGEWHARWRPAGLAAIAAAIPEQYCRPAPDRPGEHLVEHRAAYQDREQRSGPYGPPPGTAAPAPSPAPPPSGGPYGGPGRDFTNPGDQVTTPQFWAPYLEQAKAADLDWRRRREATAH